MGHHVRERLFALIYDSRSNPQMRDAAQAEVSDDVNLEIGIKFTQQVSRCPGTIQGLDASQQFISHGQSMLQYAERPVPLQNAGAHCIHNTTTILYSHGQRDTDK